MLGALVLIKPRDYHIGPGIKGHLLGESANLRTGTPFIKPIRSYPTTSEIVLWNDGCSRDDRSGNLVWTMEMFNVYITRERCNLAE